MKFLLDHFGPYLAGMASLRFLSATLEFTAAFLILYFNSIQKAIVINASLAVVGPCIFITTMALGLVGVAGQITFEKLALIGIGVFLIVLGILK
ncbi:YqhV family protein [Alkalihalobacillus sp. AL-G]|uniref:YqhV family protein n=1 Tax=Alkalihalobacillus sp. AL-G TaxID=2926399 RepID=UPI00272C56E6|nr:YqhV family protein [Alkalihalobacillus sp. AL-G]WLD92003.1 YqhV family protein [Alkalihalobacillus sp. AL-G]